MGTTVLKPRVYFRVTPIDPLCIRVLFTWTLDKVLQFFFFGKGDIREMNKFLALFVCLFVCLRDGCVDLGKYLRFE